MRRDLKTLATLMVGVFVISSFLQTSASAKARIVAIAVIRSTPELKDSALALTRQVASAIAQEPGWDFKIVQLNGKTAGDAAAAVGAEIYVMGQLLKDPVGGRLIISSFKTATDQRICDMTLTIRGATLPSNTDIAALLGESPPAPVSVGSPAVSNAGASVLAPQGTTIVVSLDNALNSYSAVSREPLSYTVVQDVIVNGSVIAKAGDEATGIVLEGQQGSQGGPYGIGWKAANLRVDVETVNSFCGDAIAMRFIRSEYRRRQGMFGSHQDLEIVKGQKYLAQVAHAQKLCGLATTAEPAPLPTDALGPDDALPSAPYGDNSTAVQTEAPSTRSSPAAGAYSAAGAASATKPDATGGDSLRSIYSFAAPAGWIKQPVDSTSGEISTLGFWQPPSGAQGGENIGLAMQPVPEGITSQQFVDRTRQSLERALGADNVKIFRSEKICGGSQTGWYVEANALVGIEPIVAEQIIAISSGQSYVATYKRPQNKSETIAARNALDSLCLPSS